MATILVVDDELGIRALLSEILTDEGHTVELAENAAQARAVRERMRPDLVLLDIWMPDVDGITLLKEWGASGHADHAGDHDERPRHHRHRGRGHQARRHGLPGKADHAAEAAARGGAGAGQAQRRAPAAGRGRPAQRHGARRADGGSGRADRPGLRTTHARAGPAGRAELRPGPPAARGARRVREELLRIPPGARRTAR